MTGAISEGHLIADGSPIRKRFVITQTTLTLSRKRQLLSIEVPETNFIVPMAMFKYVFSKHCSCSRIQG